MLDLSDLSLRAVKCSSVVYSVALRLLVINISSSSPAINNLRRLLPAISVTTCRNMVWRRRGTRVDNTWPVTALTACSDIGSESRFLSSPPVSDAPIGGGGSRWNIAMPFGTEKLERLGGENDGEKVLKICLFALTDSRT